jgi:inhibitor of cysteine peptidase
MLLVLFVLVVGCIEKEISEPTPTPTSIPILTPTPSTSPTPTADKINLTLENKINLSLDYTGRQIELTKGQTFNVTLETNPSTGYSWEVVELNTNLLQKIGEADSEPSITNEQLVGAPVMHTFQFEVINTGQTTLKIVYRRSWEQEVAPVNTFSIDIFVR